MSAKYVSALRLNRETRRKSYVDQLEVMGEAFKLFDRTEEALRCSQGIGCLEKDPATLSALRKELESSLQLLYDQNCSEISGHIRALQGAVGAEYYISYDEVVAANIDEAKLRTAIPIALKLAKLSQKQTRLKSYLHSITYAQSACGHKNEIKLSKVGDELARDVNRLENKVANMNERIVGLGLSVSRILDPNEETLNSTSANPLKSLEKVVARLQTALSNSTVAVQRKTDDAILEALAKARDESDHLRKDNQRLRDDIGQLKAELETVQRTSSSVMLHEDVGAMVGVIAGLLDTNARLSDDVDCLQKDRQRDRDALERLQNRLAKLHAEKDAKDDGKKKTKKNKNSC